MVQFLNTHGISNMDAIIFDEICYFWIASVSIRPLPGGGHP